MNRSLLLVLVMMIVNACHEKVPYDTNFSYIDQYKGDTVSLIEHPYVFEEIELKLTSLIYTYSNNQFIFTATIEGNVKEYTNSFLYFHLREDEKNPFLINADMTKAKVLNNVLTFSRTISLSNLAFDEIDFGLVHINSGERLFSLQLENITLEKRNSKP